MRRFITVAILLALVLILSSISLACEGESAEAPPSPPPVTEPVPPVQETPPQLSEGEPPSPPATEIPADYTTYTDESNLFSISYPPDWETLFEIDEKSKEVINNLKAGIPIDGAGIMIFVAGRRTATGYAPNVHIVVEPLSSEITTHEQMVEAELLGVKLAFSDYREISRVKTSVDGREATIVDFEATSPERDGRMHSLLMVIIVDKMVWTVNCVSPADDFAEWQNDFNTIVRSLRISD